MAITLVVNGVSFSYPEPNDTDWGQNATDWASAVTSGMLQKAGGSFTVTSEVDFGGLFGIMSLYFKSKSANSASTGVVRLANTDTIKWRNSTNNGDIALQPVSDTQLVFGSKNILNTDSTIPAAQVVAGTFGGSFTFNSALTVPDATTSQHALARHQLTDIQNDVGEPTGFLDTTSSTLSFVSGTRTFTIAPTGATFNFYVLGTKFAVASQNVVISATPGPHFIELNSSGVLVENTTGFNYPLAASVALVYWDNVNSVGYLIEERHGATMDWATHKYLHFTVGTRYGSGFGISGYVLNSSTDANKQLGLSGGTIYDEDLKVDITHSAAPTLPFQQILTDPAQIPIWYLNNTLQWQADAASVWIVKNAVAGANRVAFNDAVAGTQTEAGNTNFVAMWVVATTQHTNPIVIIQGQREDISLLNAQTNNSYETLIKTNFPFSEAKLLYRIIVRTDNGYGTRKFQIAEVLDFRSVSSLPSTAFIATSHGTLSGRSDANQHPASSIVPDTSAFNSILSAADDTTQKALDTLDNHGAVTSGTHGITGSFVGTTDSQTLTTKVIDTASNTIKSTGASAGYVLTSDGSANTSWAAVPSSPTAPYDLQNLGLKVSVASSSLSVAVMTKSGEIPSAGSPVKMSFRSAGISGNFTVTIASPAVISLASHGYQNNDPVVFTTTGALPTGLSVGTTYYVVNRAAGTFEVSATVGGASINTSGSQSGTHSLNYVNNYVNYNLSSGLSQVISNGSTLGHASAVAHNAWIYAINSDGVGTIKLAICSTLFDESNLITTVAEGGAGGADGNNVFYSDAVYTNVACRLIGKMVSTQATAGAWVTLPNVYTTFTPIENVYAQASISTTQAFTGGATTIIQFDTVEIDTKKAVTTGASWKFTAVKDDIYNINGFINQSAGVGWGSTERILVLVYKGGVSTGTIAGGVRVTSSFASNTLFFNFTVKIKLLKDEYIDFRINSSQNATFDNSSYIQIQGST